MVITLNKFYLIVIVALIFTILMMRACSPTSEPIKPLPPEKVIVRDTVWLKGKDSIVYKLSDPIIIPGLTIYKDVDTTVILKDYFSKVVYEDTIRIDTLGYVLIRDTITQNRVQDRTTILNYNIPIIKETITNNITTPARNQFYIGFDIFGNQKQMINYFGPSLTLKTKKDKMYSIGAGVTPEGVGAKLSTSWKIKIRQN